MDFIIGLLLTGLGLQNPFGGQVHGDATEQYVAIKDSSMQKDGMEYNEDGSVRSTKLKTQAEVRKEKAMESAGSRAVIYNSDGSMGEIGMEEIKAKREELQKLREDRRESFKQRIEEARQEALEAHEDRREAFQERLQTIQDEHKQQTVARLDQNISSVNTKRTETYTNQLNNMDKVLDRVMERAQALADQSRDTTDLEAAIGAAQSAIAAARSAVEVQAGNEYIIGITTENDLGKSVSTQITSLKSDLETVKTQVSAARTAVKNAVVALAHALGQTTVPSDATGSAQ